MLTIRQYVDFLNLLKSGNVYDGTGRKADPARVNALLDDILTQRNPYRAEWLDASFSVQGMLRKTPTITYHKIKPDKTLEKVTEPLANYLAENKAPGIDLNSW